MCTIKCGMKAMNSYCIMCVYTQNNLICLHFIKPQLILNQMFLTLGRESDNLVNCIDWMLSISIMCCLNNTIMAPSQNHLTTLEPRVCLHQDPAFGESGNCNEVTAAWPSQPFISGTRPIGSRIRNLIYLTFRFKWVLLLSF